MLAAAFLAFIIALVAAAAILAFVIIFVPWIVRAIAPVVVVARNPAWVAVLVLGAGLVLALAAIGRARALLIRVLTLAAAFAGRARALVLVGFPLLNFARYSHDPFAQLDALDYLFLFCQILSPVLDVFNKGRAREVSGDYSFI